MPRIIHEQAEWLELRGVGIGASELGACMGVSPWESPVSLWSKKLGLFKDEKRPRRFEWGLRHERTIAEWYAEATGRSVHRATSADVDGFVALLERLPLRSDVIVTKDRRVMLRSTEHPWLFSTLDTVVVDKDMGAGVVELKCSDPSNKAKWRREFPVHYRAQIEAQMLVTGLHWGGVAVLFGLDDPGWTDFDSDELLRARLVNAGMAMVDAIASRRRPEIDAHPRTREALIASHSGKCEPVKMLSVEAQRWDDAYAQACADERDAKERKLEAESHIISEIENDGQGVLPSGVVWYPSVSHREAHEVPAHTVKRFYRSERFIRR